MKVRVLALLCSLPLLAGCGGSTPAPTPAPKTNEQPVATTACVPPLQPSPEFVEVTRREVPQGGIVGLRIFYQGPEEERLVYTAGVLMDMFETAPITGGLPLAQGGTASLFRPANDRWILYWTQSDACSQYTIGGDGFSRAAFMRLLRGTGVLAQT